MTNTAGRGEGSRRAARTALRVGAVGAAVGAGLIPAGAAQAGVISVGNATFGNSCANVGGALASGATVASPGAVSGSALRLPVSLPRNHCGNSGIVCDADGDEGGGGGNVQNNGGGGSGPS
ncbi:chaplin family protein [Streptomyces sp. NPDC006632]|uniref:chaplin family protein n=1 Tax=Streptomyces sp. NPDC006632 TaxID=3157182 RepID=UPI0033A5F44D